MKSRKIPFYRTPLSEQQARAVVRTLRSGWLTTGQVCREFEERVADYLGVRHAVAVNSCTSGLHLSLVVSGIGPGDEVITTPFTFVASVEPIVHTGATPVFADIDFESFNVSPEQIARRITKRTRAIMPVHIGGLPCDLLQIGKLARKHGLRVIHDGAHALGAEYRGRKIGAIPDITSFSFYATKNITTGEGGMVTTSNSKWADRVRTLSLHGIDRHAWMRHGKLRSWYYEVKSLGYKYNLADLNASIGLAQFEDFERMQFQRTQAAEWYDSLLHDVDEVAIPPRNEHSTHAWHLYIIRIDPAKLTISRDEIIQKMAESGVGCGVHFIPIFMQPYYRRRYGLKARDFPQSRLLFERIITLPLFPGIKRGETAEVVRRLKAILRRHRRRRR